jgi:hypothetical protein
MRAGLTPRGGGIDSRVAQIRSWWRSSLIDVAPASASPQQGAAIETPPLLPASASPQMSDVAKSP